MSRYLLRIQYDGADFFGWQKQNEGSTVQGCIEKGLSTLLQVPVVIHGSGRTDSGVHAEHQAAHFDYNGELSEKAWLRRINSILPDSIVIDSIIKVADELHARYDALFRQYRYQIMLSPKPLLRNQYWYIPQELDLELIEICLNMITGVHSFENFAKVSPDVNHMKCEILKAEMVQPAAGLIHIHIRANRFLRHMVRFLVGSMVQVGRRNMFPDEFEVMLHQPDIPKKAITAPAKGLILEKVVYKE
ncbi:MAG: tRNA pseudouridine(38-40) synthase TruA [Balneolales bacterium]